MAYIISNGEISSGIILENDSMTVLDGGTANNTTVNWDGWLYVSSGGTANSTTVYDFGYLYVSSGGIANSTTVSSGGKFNVENGGTANSTTVNYYGSMYVSGGGIANSTIVNYSGWAAYDGGLNVLSEGTVNDTVINATGRLYVSSGGTANSTTVNYGGCFNVLDGGIANSTMINCGGSMIVSSGGTALLIRENGGLLTIAEGAEVSLASNTLNCYVADGNAGGIHSGTTAVNLTNYGRFTVYSGAVVDGLFTKGKYFVISSGGKVTGRVIYLNNSVVISAYEGAVVDFDLTQTAPGACALIQSLSYIQGSPSYTITVSDGQTEGVYKLAEGASGFDTRITLVDSTGKKFGTIAVGETVRFSKGTYTLSLLDKIVSSGSTTGFVFQSVLALKVGETETVSPYTSDGYVCASQGNVAVYSGEVFHDTFLGGGFRSSFLRVFSGGTALDTIVNILSGYEENEAGISVERGGLAKNTTVIHGKFVLNSGGTADDATIHGGTLVVSAGGTATAIRENGGCVEIEDGANVSFEENTFSGLLISRGTATVHSCTTALSNTVTNGDFVIYSGGIAENTTIVKYGALIVSSGGTANSTTVLSNGCHLYVSDGGVINDTRIYDSGDYAVLSGGTANMTFLAGGPRGSRASMSVSSGGTMNSTTLINNGRLHVSSGGTANGVRCDDEGCLYVSSGGTATEIIENGGYVYVEDGADVTFLANTFSGLVLDMMGWNATVHSGTTACGTIIDGPQNVLEVYSGGTAVDTVVSEGRISVFCGGTANNTVNNGLLYVSSGGMANITTVNDGGMLVSSGGTANITTVNDGGMLYVSSGGTANGVTVSSGGSMIVTEDALLTGKMTFEKRAKVSAREGAVVNFDLTQTEAGAETLVNDLSIIQGKPLYSLTVTDDWKPGNYVYSLADGAAEFTGTISVVNKAGDEFGAFAVGETVKVGYDSYTLNLNEGALSVTVESPDLTPQTPVGTQDKVAWETTAAEEYVVEYSTDNFEHVIQVVTTGNAVDMPDLPAGTYQWRVKANANSEWAVGEAIVSEPETDAAPKVVQSNADGNDDLFFANPNGTWSSLYVARHVGSVGDWNGTKEKVSADGKARIQNLFFGSADPNVLCLTDSENGDAIFVDDVFTGLPESVAEQTARLYEIQEIRAGAGDDIVDMTSQRFEYVGDGLTIRGGDGDDTIWANKGDNFLFGDAGDDRIVGASGDDVLVGGIGNDSMHGGGGNDIFTFCENWGEDTVEQLEMGTVTLWFASGDVSNWSAETLTYTDGENSVTVSGISADQITLKFGDDGSEQFTEFSRAGAFNDFTSQRIFEESDSGVLACL